MKKAIELRNSMTDIKTPDWPVALLHQLCFSMSLPVHHLQPLPAQYTLLESDKWRREKKSFQAHSLYRKDVCDWNSFVKITETKDIFRFNMWGFRRWSSAFPNWSTEVVNKSGKLKFFSNTLIEMKWLFNLVLPRLSNVAFFKTFAWNMSMMLFYWLPLIFKGF